MFSTLKKGEKMRKYKVYYRDYEGKEKQIVFQEKSVKSTRINFLKRKIGYIITIIPS